MNDNVCYFLNIIKSMLLCIPELQGTKVCATKPALITLFDDARLTEDLFMNCPEAYESLMSIPTSSLCSHTLTVVGPYLISNVSGFSFTCLQLQNCTRIAHFQSTVTRREERYPPHDIRYTN